MQIVARKLCKSFGEPPTRVLNDITLTVNDGELIAITGKSGSGKSTLLYLLSTLDTLSSGSIEISGQSIDKMSDADVHRFRNVELGFVFQFHYLLPELTALENVLMPARKTNQTQSRLAHAVALMEDFGLGNKLHRLPSQLSGGEQQRVAIARALVMEPRYVFADEPTGNLDSHNGDIVMDILFRTNREKKTTLLYVTHDHDFAAMAPRQVVLVDGRIVQ